jgi:cytochrome oxidase Cu insertion factor (SCO1/SenC/PrrC family)
MFSLKLLVVAAVVLGFPFCVVSRAEEEKVQGPKIGSPVPDVGVVDESGNPVKLSSFKGKSGVVLFFFPKAGTPG